MLRGRARVLVVARERRVSVTRRRCILTQPLNLRWGRGGEREEGKEGREERVLEGGKGNRTRRIE
jgi:hypothetical protein